MKKAILPFLMLLIPLLLPAVSDASYIIHLENGGQLLTPQYWEEDNYINFYIAGGLMGIEKNSVRTIERSTLDLDGIYEARTPEKSPAPVEPIASIPAVPEKKEKETATDDTKKDPAIMGEFKALQKKFESRKSMSIDELNELKNDLTVLREKIVSDRLKYDHLEEVNKIADMRFFVNDLIIIKSKDR
ncbi:MAG: hypothetical protein KKH02_05220 [Proteobacteria bacterium]|nr:hypothetical protein [Pseudomonadota bacterium]MCG2741841.1 hypothetical protein [Syntrophaceae bacterium]